MRTRSIITRTISVKILLYKYAGTYADEGISGTNTKKRDEFNRMIADCRAGKIDMIITKSISRFARNTLNCLNYVRELKDLGIGIIFEKENIIPWMRKAKCCLPSFPHWRRMRAAPFQRTVHGESAGGLKQESIKWVPRGSLATMRMRAAASWLLTESRRASVSGISGWKNSGLHQADFWAGRN